MSTKKLVSAALTAATILSMTGLAALPLANAQSTADLQAQISALLAQIQQLQSQLGGSNSGSAMTSYNFTSNLTVGSTGESVRSLQAFLNGHGFHIAASGAGSPGNESTYFGALTKAALAKFQAANGIAPAVGYFGPITRAFINAMSVPGGTGTGTGTGTGGTTAPATGLSVSLASDNPGAGSLVSGAARIPVLAFNLTAGNSGAVTVSELKFHKTGVLSDSAISGAYLVQNGKVVAQYNSINQGVIDFSGLNWQVSAGQSQELTLAIDTTGSNSGNTTGFSLMSASDVTAWDTANNAVTVSGGFPLNGSTFTLTTVSNPTLGSLLISSSSIGTQVTAGTQGNLVGAWTFQGSSNKLWLKSLNFRVIGSANKGDIRNVKLMVNGTQVGATLATVAQDGTAYFDASANPGVLNTGNNNVQVFADVAGSPSYTFQFEVLNGYDVLAVDSQYNVPVAVTGLSNPSSITIQPGQITVTQDSNTPTGNIARGQSQVTLAKFDIYAAGEAVRVKWLGFQLAFQSPTNATMDDVIRNISLTDDAGGQVGSTINTPSTTNVCTNDNSNPFTNSTTTYINCFGSSGSPINYVIPANTTRVLSLKGDIQSGAAFGTVTASLTGNVGNLQGITSSNTGPSGSAAGSALTLSNSSLTVSKNNGVGSQNVSAGVLNQRIGSYSLTASSAEGVNINNVSVEAYGPYFQNLKVMVNGSQFGTTQGSVSSGTIYTFSGAPFNVPAGNTVNVDVYADTLSSATGTLSKATTLTGLSGSGAISYTAISLASGQDGQQLSFSGSATIAVSADSTQPPSGQIVMGSTGNTLAIFRVTETSNVENVKVTDLTVNASTTGNAAFSNVTLWNGSTLLGTAGSASSVSGGYAYTFHFGSSVIVPQANSVSLTLKGDAATYSSNGATDNATTTFFVAATSSVTALGATSNKTATVSSVSGATGNAQTVLRSAVTVSTAATGGTSHNKSNPDTIGTVTFSANSAGPVALRTLTLTFSGSAVTTGSSTFLGALVASGTQAGAAGGNIQLIDQNGNNVLSAGEAAASTTIGTGYATSTVVWTFTNSGTTGGGFQISSGNSYTFTLRVNDSVIPGTANISQSLGANIQNAGDVTYWDALDASSTAITGLPASVVPLQINSVTYPIGN